MRRATHLARLTSTLAATLAAALSLLAAGCQGPPSRQPAEPPPPPRAVSEWQAREGADEVELEAVGEAASTSESVTAGATIVPAAARDFAYDSDEPILVRRYVYRVRLAIPSALGEAQELSTPGAELYIDASRERARVRFAGTSWPLDVGAEVRLRGDSRGAYAFDGEGGRPLLPGELGAWFEGGPRRPGPGLSVRRDPSPPSEEPGALVCAFLAEWFGEDRDSVMRRCDEHAPISFRVGLWRAVRTADVLVEMPRRALRADELVPPPPIPRTEGHAFFEPASLGRITPASARGEELEAPSPLAPSEGLVVENRGPTRVIITASGVPIGWVAPRSSASFEGLQPGPLWVGGLRPMGSIALRPRLVSIPAHTVLRVPREPRPH